MRSAFFLLLRLICYPALGGAVFLVFDLRRKRRKPSAGEPSAGEPSAGEPSAGKPSAGEP